jgi:catechol 2,3-dioxygenase-like lactoylglutathione lyase family enzyme
VAAMNYFTLLSDDLEATRRFYCDPFGFEVGWRPPSQFTGWWLYAGDTSHAWSASRRFFPGNCEFSFV